MLEEKDLQSIGKLLDEKFDEMGAMVNKGFTDMQVEINGLKEDIKLRPTKTEIFGWADKRIVDLELAKDRHDFMHINELDKLPSQPEISRVLVERGFKEKTVQPIK